MGPQNKARFFAAATLTLLLAASQGLAGEKMGKEIRVDEVLKGANGGQSGTARGSQTARKPAQGDGDGDAFGVERPAPEGRDPNEVVGGGDGAERALDGGGDKGGSTAKSAGGNKAGGKPKNTSGDNGDGDDLPPGDL